MITFETFLIGVAIVSSFTCLATEAIKKILKEFDVKYYANTLAGVVSAVLAIGLGTGYVILSELDFSKPVIVYIAGLAFASWIASMEGYDKFIQTISQFKTNGKG